MRRSEIIEADAERFWKACLTARLCEMTNNMNHDTRPSLGLETIPNARDLGGLAGLSGRRVRSGKLYRSANPALASAADLDRLHSLDLRRFLDREVHADPAPLPVDKESLRVGSETCLAHQLTCSIGICRVSE